MLQTGHWDNSCWHMDTNRIGSNQAGNPQISRFSCGTRKKNRHTHTHLCAHTHTLNLHCRKCLVLIWLEQKQLVWVYSCEHADWVFWVTLESVWGCSLVYPFLSEAALFWLAWAPANHTVCMPHIICIYVWTLSTAVVHPMSFLPVSVAHFKKHKTN